MSCRPWDVIVDPACCPGWNEIPESVREQAILLASETMWALSGRRFAICDVCIRPCKAFCLCCGTGWKPPGMWGVRQGWRPYVNGDGQWVNCGCGCDGGCCKAACAVWLDPAPLIASEPVVVTIGGIVQDPASYQVLNGNILVRSEGEGCWPECNDLASPNTAPGTWSIAYSWGYKPPLAGRRMAGVLACEIAKQCMGMKCRLPSRVTQLSRDGVSLTLDPLAFIGNGLTELPEVNAWLRQVNPYGLAQPGEVYSPDIAAPYQVTYPSGRC